MTPLSLQFAPDFIKAKFSKWSNNPPPEMWLKRMSAAEWPEYESWLFRYSFLSRTDWCRQRQISRKQQIKPLLSILTPVFNISRNFLHECVESVLCQSYPYWELLLVDDASTNAETLSHLNELKILDDRITVYHNRKNIGICKTTNKAIGKANGDFSVFLDHDDKLAPNALFELAQIIDKHPDADIIYSDRDLISQNGYRFMFLFKPEWAPETIFSSNYLCHLTSYRTALLRRLEGLDEQTEGSQDHDLILRAEETNPHIYHIPKVLYHWRQHPGSVAFNPDSKEYAYEAAQRSISRALQRRNIQGSVQEITQIWRGNYRVRLQRPPVTDIHIHRINNFQQTCWQETFILAIEQSSSKPFIIFLDHHFLPSPDDSLEELASWFQISDIAMTTGKIVDGNDEIIHAGLLFTPDGCLHTMYNGRKEEAAPGYMAWASTTHNVSLVHPGCFAIRRTILEQSVRTLQRIGKQPTPFALSIHLLTNKKRIIYTPFARFYCREGEKTNVLQSEKDSRLFFSEWKKILRHGDPYLSRNLTVKDNDIALNFSSPPFPP